MTVDSRLRVLHLGSYFQGENDIVNLMQRGLAPLCDMKAVDLQLYRTLRGRRIPSSWVEPDEGRNWLRPDKIDPIIEAFQPHVIICNAGGISFRPEHHERLARKGVLRAGIALSDPDVFPYHGRVFAKHFDLFYTNARSSIPDYEAIGVKARLLAFAGLPEFHRRIPGVRKRFDVVVVGGARPERIGFIENLRARGISVGVYGGGWPRSGLFRTKAVHGEAQVRAINSGKIYLSFSKTTAGFVNVKAGIFEAAACGACILTERFPEMEYYFKYDKEILGYDSFEEAVNLIKRYVSADGLYREVAGRCYRRFLAEHTWHHRWQKVLADVEERLGNRQGKYQ